MRELIIKASIDSLRQEGLKFSVDMLANKLKISKKTIYKIFPNKEALALALYEKYYGDVIISIHEMKKGDSISLRCELLHLYFDSKMMTRKDIFNKYKLNDTIYSYVSVQNNKLWDIISEKTNSRLSEHDIESIKLIIDGTFEKLCNENKEPDDVIERLVQLL